MREPLRYVKKDRGTVVEAMKLTDDNVASVANWCQGQMVTESDALNHNEQDALNISTPDGRRRISLGDYVVKLGSDFYPAKPTRFEALYEVLPE